MNSLVTKIVTCATAALVAVFLLAPVPALAVVKSFQVMQNGQPLPRGTKVTLTAPSGKTYEEEVDDEDGRVIGFNFNEDGDWNVSWAGGSMVINAGRGVGPWLVGATAIGVTGAIIAANDSDNDDGPVEEPPSNGGGNGNGNGMFEGGLFIFQSTSIVSNPDDHPPSGLENCTYNVVPSGSSLTISCSSPDANFSASGSLNTMDLSFSVSGSGDYFGFTTTYTIDGSFTPTPADWEGTISTCNGGCPDTNDNGSQEPLVLDFVGDID